LFKRLAESLRVASSLTRFSRPRKHRTVQGPSDIKSYDGSHSDQCGKCPAAVIALYGRIMLLFEIAFAWLVAFVSRPIKRLACTTARVVSAGPLLGGGQAVLGEASQDTLTNESELFELSSTTTLCRKRRS